jgi:predicted transcriptional regulator
VSREKDLEAEVACAITDIELGPLVSDIVSAYVGHHMIQAANVPQLIQSVRTTLLSLGQAPSSPEGTRQPAVPSKKASFPITSSA